MLSFMYVPSVVVASHPRREKNVHTCVRNTQVITSYNERDNRVLRTEENALLSKHNDNLKDMLERLDGENKEQYSCNEQLRKHLMDLKRILTNAFEHIGIPDSYEKPTLENIDSYMLKLVLQLLMAKGTQEHRQLIKEIKAIMKRLQTRLVNGTITPVVAAKGNNAHLSSSII